MPQVTVLKDDVVLPNGVLYQEDDVAFLTESEVERLSAAALESYVDIIEGDEGTVPSGTIDGGSP